MGLQVKITSQSYEEKTMKVKITSKWLEADDPNNNGYYKLKWVGKVRLIQLLTDTPEVAFNPDISDLDIISWSAPTWTNCVLRLDGWGIAHALCEVLSATK